MKHFHIYDVCGEVMCVDAAIYRIDEASLLFFFEHANLDDYPNEEVYPIATFNWSNVVCVREEEDEDDGEDSTPLPDYLQGVLN